MSLGSAVSDKALEEAAQWFARLNSRSVSNDALHAFRAWRQEPGNDEAFLAAERVWRESGQLELDPAIERVVAETLIRTEPRGGRRRGGKWVPAAGLAAILIVAALLLATVRAVTFRQTFATAVGQQRLVILQDGSRVRLDTGSKIAVRFTPTARDVELAQGQAFFEVAHDPGRPFTVFAGGSQVRAVGTRFDVRRDDQQVRVDLVQGVVKVTTPNASGGARQWTLAPGDRLTASPARQSLQQANLDDDTSWVSGRLIFDNVPLQAAIAEVNRYNRGQIILNAPAVADVRVNGTFESTQPAGFVSAVTGLYRLRATAEPDGSIVLSPAPGAVAGAS